MSNTDNHLISIEPSYMNMGRLMSNLRLNNLLKNHTSILCDCSDKTKTGKFLAHQDPTFMSKGGKIADQGNPIHIMSLDDIEFQDIKKVRGIKIDTEGEDYKVLLGAKNIIR